METSSLGVCRHLFYNYKRSDKGWGGGDGGVCVFFLHKSYSVAENRRTWRTKPVINHHLLRSGCTSAAWRGCYCKLCRCAQNARSWSGRTVPAEERGVQSNQVGKGFQAEMTLVGLCWDGCTHYLRELPTFLTPGERGRISLPPSSHVPLTPKFSHGQVQSQPSQPWDFDFSTFLSCTPVLLQLKIQFLRGLNKIIMIKGTLFGKP